MNFKDKLQKSIAKNQSLLCVGLDPNLQDLKGAKDQFAFNKSIINQTADLVSCFKPQIAFYAASGLKGLDGLKKTVDYIHKNYPQIPVLLDAKRGDVGHASEMYVKEAFDVYGADAVTVNPYLGFDSLEPFFQRKDKGIFVLCKTSNKSASDFQDLKVDSHPLYIEVAKKAAKWNKKFKNIGLVVGSTWPNDLRSVRKIAPQLHILIPGVGAQGGDLQKTVEYGLSKKQGLIISASRSLIYAQDPQSAAKNLRDEINRYR